MYTKKDFENQMQTLQFKGFNFKKEVQGFSWKQEIDSRVNQIIIGYKVYPGSFYMQTPFVSILFIEIENILKNSCENSGIRQDYSQYTIHAQLGNLQDVNYQVFDTEINDETTFLLVANEVKKVIEKGAFPFFDKCNALPMVANLLADKKPEEIVQYIEGPILLPKTILILREANHPEYKKKLNEFFLVLKQYADKKESYRPFLNVFNNLFSDEIKNSKQC